MTSTGFGEGTAVGGGFVISERICSDDGPLLLGWFRCCFERRSSNGLRFRSSRLQQHY
jgi:hypothetical protein